MGGSHSDTALLDARLVLPLQTTGSNSEAVLFPALLERTLGPLHYI